MSQLRKVIEAKLNSGTLASTLGNTTLVTPTGTTTTKSIFYDHTPAGATIGYPLIVHSNISGVPKATNVQRIEDERWQIDADAQTLDSLETVVNLVKSYLDKYVYTGADFRIYKCVYDNALPPTWDDDLAVWSQTIEFLISYEKV